MTGKQFFTFQDIVDKNPKIIHVCCSGAYEGGEFCMKLEAGNGMEEEINLTRLKQLLDVDGKGSEI